jgi:hypothetical protein
MKPLHKTGTHQEVDAGGHRKSMSSMFLRTIADTTWRIFVPVTLFVTLGIWADLTQRGTRPWLTLGGMVLGFIFAAVLINRQIKKVRM